MQWWAWVIVGAILLGSELTFVNAQFYLVFLGAAALLVGLLAGIGMVQADWLEWVIFAALAAISMVSFRRTVYQRLQRRLPVMPQGPAGEVLVLQQDLSPGASCRLEHRGTSWTAVNGGREPIAAGARARVSRIDGLTLIVHGEP
jgi:membrane protein implicated in regulation of membrane protease activity